MGKHKIKILIIFLIATIFLSVANFLPQNNITGKVTAVVYCIDNSDCSNEMLCLDGSCVECVSDSNCGIGKLCSSSNSCYNYCGDLNGDGDVKNNDLKILIELIKSNENSKGFLLIADVNSDNVLNQKDIFLINRYINGDISELDCNLQKDRINNVLLKDIAVDVNEKNEVFQKDKETKIEEKYNPPTNEGTSCNNILDCPIESICLNNKCVLNPSDLKYCEDGIGCNFGETCFQNFCLEKECSKNSECSTNLCHFGICIECKSHVDCPGDEICLLDTKCVEEYEYSDSDFDEQLQKKKAMLKLLKYSDQVKKDQYTIEELEDYEISDPPISTEDGVLTFVLSAGQKSPFDLGGEDHSLAVNEVTEDSATITISSEPQTLSLEVGSFDVLDIDGDGLEDIIVDLLDINQETLEIKLDVIDLLNFESYDDYNDEGATGNTNDEASNSNNNNMNTGGSSNRNNNQNNDRNNLNYEFDINPINNEGDKEYYFDENVNNANTKEDSFLLGNDLVGRASDKIKSIQESIKNNFSNIGKSQSGILKYILIITLIVIVSFAILGFAKYRKETSGINYYDSNLNSSNGSNNSMILQQGKQSTRNTILHNEVVYEDQHQEALHKYIINQREKGFNDNEIKKALLKAGWKKNLVEQFIRL